MSGEWDREDVARSECETVYLRLGLLDAQGDSLPLHMSCLNAKACWQGIESRYPADLARSGISRPWIGSKYEALRLVVIGINQNQWGGLTALEELVRGARGQFDIPRRHASGSSLWHRVACYSAAFCEAAGVLNLSWGSDGFPALADVGQAFEFIAYTNQIKCSPAGDRGKPSKAMWNQCGRHVLKDELNALKPQTLLVLGKGDNTNCLNQSVLNNSLRLESRGRVQEGVAVVAGHDLAVYVVPHPTAFGGLSGHIMQDLRGALADT